MIVNNAQLSRFAGFGSTSPESGGDCPAQGSWENWCDCMWPGSSAPGINAACRKTADGLFSNPALRAAPWTDLGAAARGIPKPGSWIAPILQTVMPTTPQAAPPVAPPVIGTVATFDHKLPVIRTAGGGTAVVTGGPGVTASHDPLHHDHIQMLWMGAAAVAAVGVGVVLLKKKGRGRR